MVLHYEIAYQHAESGQLVIMYKCPEYSDFTLVGWQEYQRCACVQVQITLVSVGLRDNHTRFRNGADLHRQVPALPFS